MDDTPEIRAADLAEALESAERDAGYSHIVAGLEGILHVSRRVEEITRLSRSQILALPSWLGLVHPADRPRVAQLVGSLPQEPDLRRVSTQLMDGAQDGVRVDLIVRGLRTTAGRPLTVVQVREPRDRWREAPVADADLIQDLVRAMVDGPGAKPGTLAEAGARFAATAPEGSFAEYADRFARTGLGSFALVEEGPHLVVVSPPGPRDASTACFLKLGYLRGAASRILKQPVLVAETRCVRRGDPECRFVLRGLRPAAGRT